jgi:hypothetical protein
VFVPERGIMLTNFVYLIQRKNRKTTGPNQWFFCLLKGSRKAMIHPSWVVCSICKKINRLYKKRKNNPWELDCFFLRKDQADSSLLYFMSLTLCYDYP